MPDLTLPIEIRDLRMDDLENLGWSGGEEPEEWDDDQPDGTVVRYRTICTLMRKRLS